MKKPETYEEARKLQERIERLYEQLGQARTRGKSLRFRELLAQQYIRAIDLMMAYKRERSHNER